MPRTYEAILKGNRVNWTGDAPEGKKPVRVHITLVEEEDAARGEKMAAALAKLAQANAFSAIANPAAWQREIRQDRPLPGRSS